VHLTEPDAVETPRLGRVDEVEALPERGGLIAAAAGLELHEDSEVEAHKGY